MTTVPYQTHIKKEQLIIEYVGELIRPILCDPREKYYDSKVLFIRLVFYHSVCPISIDRESVHTCFVLMIVK